MKILKETKTKEKLPTEFITSLISKGWEEVGNIKSNIEAIKDAFSGTAKLEKILQDLLDAYLIEIGQLELHLEKKDYFDFPKDDELKESLHEDFDTVENEEEQAVETNENEETKAEVTANLLDTDVKVTKEDETIKIELSPAEDASNDAFEETALDTIDTDNVFDIDFDEPELDEETDSRIRA